MDPKTRAGEMRVRPARPSDYSFYAACFPELGTGDPTPPRERFETEYAPDTLVAEDDDGPLGFVHTELLEGQGYVRQIVVRPEARRRGVGRRLMEAVRSDLRSRGAETWRLNVLQSNAPAIGLYTSLGFELGHVSHAIRFPWSLVDTLEPVDASHEVVTLDEANACRAERAFELVPGILKRGVVLPHRFGRAIAVGDELVGVALFDASFPGAFPFRVKSPAWAKALLSALRPHRLPGKEDMGLVAEGDPNLSHVLCDRGATIKLVMQHMRAALD